MQTLKKSNLPISCLNIFRSLELTCTRQFTDLP